MESSTQYTSSSSRKQPANACTKRKQFIENASVALQQPILTHALTKCPPVGWKYFAMHSAATLGWWRNEWNVSWGPLFAVAKFNPTVFRSLCAIVPFLRFHYLCSGPTVKSFKMVLKWQKSRYVSTLVQCFDDFPSRVKKFEINLSFIPAIVKLHWKNLSRDTPSYKRKDAAPLNTYRLY